MKRTASRVAVHTIREVTSRGYIHKSLSSLCFRVTECNAEISEIRRKRDTDLKELEAATKELATMSNAEKQRIVMQISSVQTELKRTMDER